MTTPFVHLHVHTQYSMLDGAIRLADLIDKTQAYGMNAVAVTDHGAMYGALEFYTKANKAGIKPLVGCEFYISETDHLIHDKSAGHNFHIVLLAMNETGYRNLMKLASIAQTKGFYYKPRIDRKLLFAHQEGLIALTACLHGEIPWTITHHGLDKAKVKALELQQVFGDRLYFEIQENGIPEQRTVNDGLMELGNDLGVKLVATNDCHYLNQEESYAHEVLLCIQTSKTINDANRFKFSTDELYFKPPDVMAKQFSYCPEALANTLEVADRCNLKLEFKENHFPIFPVPEGESLETLFEKACRDGLEQRLEHLRSLQEVSPELEQQYQERLEMEIGVIQEMGFSGYFLIVADFINWAKSQKIPVGPGRGSGAGSLAAFCMSITDIDPIPYGLLFERFLNVERVSMPDFDVDFCKERRDEVIDYVRQRYGGDDHVAQIVAYGSMKARAVLRDVGRVLEVPLPVVDKIAKLVPDELKITLKKAIKKEPRLRDAMQQDPAVQKLLTVAQVLEGLSRHKSTHAAGVVVSPKAMVEYLPVCVGSKKEILTQFDMKYTEMTGLIKFDFLGLKTLTVIDRALRLIKQDIGTWIDLSKIPMDDQRTYNLLCAGNSLGVFQLESDGMRELLIKMAPEQFTDLIALVALYRPGPLDSGMVDQFVETKHGRRPPEYPLPQIKPVLEETYGVIVYQEQVMKISNILASYSLGDADILRRAMGKKIPEVMEEERGKFMAGAKGNNIPEEKAAYVFDLMAKFAGYGFNKCVVGSTRILDAETGERITVEELYQNQRSFTVHALGKDSKFRPRKVLDVIENGQKPVFELRTAQGHRITATANHPFRTLDGWTLLGDLKPGDRIAAPRRLPAPGGGCWAEQLSILPCGLNSTEDTIPADVCVWVDEKRRRADLTWCELESRSGVCMREFMGKGSSKKRGFRRSTLARLADFFASKRLAALAESDIFWDSVVSIEPRGQQQTFDLTVEKDHNFVADGLIVHNSHSAAYALVAYQTAYLKAHYPAQFLAALLSCDIDNTDKVVKYISECKQMSIPVLPPDINESYQDFTVINDRVRFGLGAVKNVGGSALELVIKEREKNGAYTGLADFCGRIDSSKVNRKVLENLIKAGAFDFVQAKRSQLMEVLDQALEHAKAVQRDRLSGQMSLFAVAGMGAGGDDQSTAEITFPSMEEWPDLQKLSYEKETIGFFLTGHPLDGVIETIRMVADAEIEALDSWREGQAVRVGGLIQQYKEIITKKGDRMAFAVLEDMTSRVEVIVFSDAFANCSHFLGKDEPLIVLGTIQQGERGAKIIAEDIYPLDQAIEQFTEQATVLLHADRIGRNKLIELKELIYQFHGATPITLTLHFDGRGEVDILPMKDITIRPCPDFFNKVKASFGKGCLSVQMRQTQVQRKKRFGGQR
ncbi:MAG: DNA polymerase III subunit alpha [Candidatus Electrothrix sp. AW1]|nr:DNA polymerase III subunit alpha [Candidatus Electrothrix gigas]